MHKYQLSIFSIVSLTHTLIAEHDNISKSQALKIAGEYLNTYPAIKIIMRQVK